MTNKEKRIKELKQRIVRTRNDALIGSILDFCGCYREHWKAKAIAVLTPKQRKHLIKLGKQQREFRAVCQKYVDKQKNIIWRVG